MYSLKFKNSFYQNNDEEIMIFSNRVKSPWRYYKLSSPWNCNTYSTEVHYCLNNCDHCTDNIFCHFKTKRINSIKIEFPKCTNWNTLKNTITNEIQPINRHSPSYEDNSYIYWEWPYYQCSLEKKTFAKTGTKVLQVDCVD